MKVKRKKHGGFLNTLIYILLFPLYLISIFFPKNKNLFLFGSGHGQSFIDNSKYLFLEANKNKTVRKLIYISNNREVVKHIANIGFNSVYANSVNGMWMAIRASICFITHSTHDIHPLLIGGAEIIQLWHGTPLKKIAHDVLSLDNGIKAKIRKLIFDIFPYINASMKFNKIITSSDSIVNNYKSAFRVDNSKIIALGQARNDVLDENYVLNNQIFPEKARLDELKKNNNHIITWMPTHRLKSGGGLLKLIDRFKFDFSRLNSDLEKYNACFVIKVHPLDSSDIKSTFANFERIIMYEYADPYPLIKYTDILVTDYSSIYFDFLLLNRPIIFAPFDYETYLSDDAGFYYDYNEVTPGDKCYNWNSLLESINKHLENFKNGQTDNYLKKRVEISKQFNDYQFGNSARIIEKLFNG